MRTRRPPLVDTLHHTRLVEITFKDRSTRVTVHGLLRMFGDFKCWRYLSEREFKELHRA